MFHARKGGVCIHNVPLLVLVQNEASVTLRLKEQVDITPAMSKRRPLNIVTLLLQHKNKPVRRGAIAICRHCTGRRTARDDRRLAGVNYFGVSESLHAILVHFLRCVAKKSHIRR